MRGAQCAPPLEPPFKQVGWDDTAMIMHGCLLQGAMLYVVGFTQMFRWQTLY